MEWLDSWPERMTTGLLAGQLADGSFGCHPYRKWTRAHWRLVSLVELGLPPGHADGVAAAETVLNWIASPSESRVIAGRERRHASMEGNAIFVCCRLGLSGDPRVRLLVERLLHAQWPDGGRNCDEHPAAWHSSFHESVTPIRGLAAYAEATGDGTALSTARRAAASAQCARPASSRTRGRPRRWSGCERSSGPTVGSERPGAGTGGRQAVAVKPAWRRSTGATPRQS